MNAKRTLTSLRRFRQNKSGLAAIEFALVAPFLILMMFGGAEVSQLLSIDRKITQAASTLADLAAQDDRLTCTELDGIVAATGMVVAPFDTAPMSLQLTSVVLDSGGNPVVEWSRTAGCGVGRAPGSAGPAPANLIPSANAGIIVGEVNYNFSSGFTQLAIQNMTIRKTFFLLPRKTPKVCFDGVTSTGCP